MLDHMTFYTYGSVGLGMGDKGRLEDCTIFKLFSMIKILSTILTSILTICEIHTNL